MAADAYRIESLDGETVEVVRPDLVEFALALWNDRRELDIDGNPIGAYVAVPCDRPIGWGA